MTERQKTARVLTSSWAFAQGEPYPRPPVLLLGWDNPKAPGHGGKEVPGTWMEILGCRPLPRATACTPPSLRCGGNMAQCLPGHSVNRDWAVAAAKPWELSGGAHAPRVEKGLWVLQTQEGRGWGSEMHVLGSVATGVCTGGGVLFSSAGRRWSSGGAVPGSWVL